MLRGRYPSTVAPHAPLLSDILPETPFIPSAFQGLEQLSNLRHLNCQTLRSPLLLPKLAGGRHTGPYRLPVTSLGALVSKQYKTMHSMKPEQK